MHLSGPDLVLLVALQGEKKNMHQICHKSNRLQISFGVNEKTLSRLVGLNEASLKDQNFCVWWLLKSVFVQVSEGDWLSLLARFE